MIKKTHALLAATACLGIVLASGTAETHDPEDDLDDILDHQRSRDLGAVSSLVAMAEDPSKARYIRERALAVAADLAIEEPDSAADQAIWIGDLRADIEDILLSEGSSSSVEVGAQAILELLNEVSPKPEPAELHVELVGDLHEGGEFEVLVTLVSLQDYPGARLIVEGVEPPDLPSRPLLADGLRLLHGGAVQFPVTAGEVQGHHFELIADAKGEHRLTVRLLLQRSGLVWDVVRRDFIVTIGSDHGGFVSVQDRGFDDDRDGVLDRLDMCPTTGVGWPVDIMGCHSSEAGGAPSAP